MSCCGNIVKKAKKIKNIAQGELSILAEKYFKAEILKCSNHDTRFNICIRCNKKTYYTIAEYAQWLRDNGIILTLNNIDNLEQFRALDSKPQRPNTYMCCRICKCYLDAKCRVESEHCPLGRW